MSVVDHFGNPVVQKPVDPQDPPESGFSSAHANDSAAFAQTHEDAPEPPVSEQQSEDFPESRLSELAAPALMAADTVTLPVLGTAPVERHQRTLLIMLGVALLVLALVAGFALRQSNTVAQ